MEPKRIQTRLPNFRPPRPSGSFAGSGFGSLLRGGKNKKFDATAVRTVMQFFGQSGGPCGQGLVQCGSQFILVIEGKKILAGRRKLQLNLHMASSVYKILTE